MDWIQVESIININYFWLKLFISCIYKHHFQHFAAYESLDIILLKNLTQFNRVFIIFEWKNRLNNQNLYCHFTSTYVVNDCNWNKLQLDYMIVTNCTWICRFNFKCLKTSRTFSRMTCNIPRITSRFPRLF